MWETYEFGKFISSSKNNFNPLCPKPLHFWGSGVTNPSTAHFTKRGITICSLGSSYAWSMAKSSPFGKMPSLGGFPLHLLMFPFYYQFYTKAETYNESPNMKRDAPLNVLGKKTAFSQAFFFFFVAHYGFRMTALESSCHKIQMYVKSFSVHCGFSAAG